MKTVEVKQKRDSNPGLGSTDCVLSTWALALTRSLLRREKARNVGEDVRGEVG